MKHSLAHIEEIAAGIGLPADALTLYGSSRGKAQNKRPACL
jgi:formyltetrahydrofolate synthetase